MYLEFEKKGLITAGDYNKIIANNNVTKEISQTNYYFETKDNFFKQNHSALRVRIVEDTYELTLKVRKDIGNVEYNHIINKETFENLLYNFEIPKVIFDYVDNNIKLDNVIHFKTKRSIIFFKEHNIEIDMTEFDKTIDYEIEVEAQNMNIASNIYNDFLLANNIMHKESLPKIARYHIYNSK